MRRRLRCSMFWKCASYSRISPLRNDATALRNRQEFQRSQLTELASSDFESWQKKASTLPQRLLIETMGGLVFRELETKTAPCLRWLPCFLRDTLLVRAGLLTEG